MIPPCPEDRGERGSVVAEFAVALPAIVLVLLLACGALAAGGTQIRLQDAAADAARLAARGEAEARTAAAVEAAVPGAGVELRRDGDVVCVTASTQAPVLLAPLAATACALEGGG